MLVYKIGWVIGLPFALVYLYWRGRKDKLYTSFVAERFGSYSKNEPCDLWVHAVSLGEMRSAAPIIQRYLDAGKKVVVTNFTPAGRRATKALFDAEINAGKLYLLYVPVEYDWAYKKFFKAFQPKLGLVMEIEIWPQMVFSAHKHAVPLFLCNAQYPEHSFKRDTVGVFAARGDLVAGYAGILAKSDRQRKRFESLGGTNVKIMGETRFDQPINPHLIAASIKFKKQEALKNRPIVTLASVVEAEESIYLSLIETIQANVRKQGYESPLFIWVQRAPERFESIVDMLKSEGQRVAERSQLFDDDLQLATDWNDATDILVGDSIGEMYFYLNLCDAAIVSGGFLPSGAHNVIEPLALEKATFVGPTTWSIEYPAEEAVSAGVLHRVQTPEELVKSLYDHLYKSRNKAEFTAKAQSFFLDHSGATQKALDHLPVMLNTAGFKGYSGQMKDMLK